MNNIKEQVVLSKINLPVDVESLKQICEKLTKRYRDVEHTHDALVTLESFIVLFGKSAHGLMVLKLSRLLMQLPLYIIHSLEMGFIQSFKLWPKTFLQMIFQLVRMGNQLIT